MTRGIFKNGNKGLFKKGMTSPNKGKKFSYKARPKAKGRKIWCTGKKLTEEHKNKLRLSHLDKIVSEETRKKLSIASKKNGNRPPVHRGSDNVNWKGGIAKENDMIRHSIEGELWRNSVFARDGYTCKISGIKGGSLVAHHILNFAQYPALRTSIENGITLSKEVHIAFHKKYGKKNNTSEQLVEFAKDFIIGQNA